jgi:hypothetical protein
LKVKVFGCRCFGCSLGPFIAGFGPECRWVDS